MGEPLKTRYKYLFPKMMEIARKDTQITENNIYQPKNSDMEKLVEDNLLKDSFLPASAINGIEHIEKFMELVNSGKRGIIFMEHYSNFDLPGFIYLLHKSPNKTLNELADKIVAIAGMKLSEDNPLVSAWAEGFNRIVIYPSRSLAAITDPEKRAEEEMRSKKINFASMRALSAARERGQVILVFPSGTRYRPGKPETKRGVREIDSYLRLSDVMLLFSINGNCLRISEDHPEDMSNDMVCPDVVLYNSTEVMECAPFRAQIVKKLESENYEGDKKQVVVDSIMNILEDMHNKSAPIRDALV